MCFLGGAADSDLDNRTNADNFFSTADQLIKAWSVNNRIAKGTFFASLLLRGPESAAPYIKLFKHKFEGSTHNLAYLLGRFTSPFIKSVHFKITVREHT